jgi:hypothetical protein
VIFRPREEVNRNLKAKRRLEPRHRDSEPSVCVREDKMKDGNPAGSHFRRIVVADIETVALDPADTKGALDTPMLATILF